MTRQSTKKDYCVRRAFENLRLASFKAEEQQRLRKEIEYEKTVKLLRLVGKDPLRSFI